MSMIILTLMIFGVIAYVSMNVNQMPDIKIPYVTIQTIYAGAGPKEIESQITKKIEDAISTVSGIEKITSYSLDGVSVVLVEFKLKKDVDVANQEVKSKVDGIINDLPSDAKTPIVSKIDINAKSIMDIVLSGHQSAKELYEIADKKLKDRFSQIPGVAQVSISGGQKREIHIVMDNQIAYENGVSMPSLMQSLAAQNYDLPGGYFQEDNQEFTVRFSGKLKTLDDIRNLQVATLYGPKKLSQFALVEDSGEKIRQSAIYYDNSTKVENSNVVRLSIIKASDGNVVKVAKAVKEAMPDIQSSLPSGMHLELVQDGSTFVVNSVNDLMSNIVLGIIFTAIVLFLFLFDWRSTLIIALSMPTSVIITFVLMQAFGISKNMMSLMGLSVTIGVLVANSVVVIENIFRYKSLGANSADSAEKGTDEVVTAVFASTLTNIVVFLPLAAMNTMIGMMIKELALTACFASLLSIFMSFTLTPMLAKIILPSKIVKTKLTDMADKIESILKRYYLITLNVVLKNKKAAGLTLAVTVALFILIVGGLSRKVGTEMVPTTDNGLLLLTTELPTGYNLDQTRKLVNVIEKRLSKYKDVTYMLTNIGKKTDTDIGTNMAAMTIKLTGAGDRDKTITQIMGEITRDLADIPGVNFNITTSSAMREGHANNPVDFYIEGPNSDKLEEYKYQVIQKLKDVPGLINFDNSSRAGKPEITIRPKREMLNEAGLTAQVLAITLRASLEGMQATDYTENGENYDLVIKFGGNSVNTPEKVANITVIAPTGVTYRMSQLADIVFTKGYTKIMHDDKQKAIEFTGSNSEDIPVGTVNAEIEKRIKTINFDNGYSFKWGGSSKMMNEMIADMLFAFLLAIVLTYILLVAILESFVQPIYILMTLPLAMIGVYLALYGTGTSLGFTALFAIIMLLGIVVNNAILILDYTNQLVREKKFSIKDALLEASPTKLKAVLMSSIAVILGMLPMALGIGSSGTEISKPMGVVSVGGLVASTILTLWVIPAMYYFFSRNKKKKADEDDPQALPPAEPENPANMY